MDKKSYFVNVLEAKDGKIAETMNFNFGGHHDLGNMAERARESGLFAKDKHAKGIRTRNALHAPRTQENPDVELFKEFAPQFDAFKQKVRDKLGCGCSCTCDK